MKRAEKFAIAVALMAAGVAMLVKARTAGAAVVGGPAAGAVQTSAPACGGFTRDVDGTLIIDICG